MIKRSQPIQYPSQTDPGAIAAQYGVTPIPNHTHTGLDSSQVAYSSILGAPAIGQQTYTPAASGTATLSLSGSNVHFITMPAGNITIATSGGVVGQCFAVVITQDGTGSRTVSWFSTIRWASGITPTLTTTASKSDIFVFVCSATGDYFGVTASLDS